MPTPKSDDQSGGSSTAKQAAKQRISPSPQDGRKKRIAYVNLDRPPQERQRVWRACEACRKKKVKCNGEEPCQTCISYKLQCFYADNESATARIDMEYVSKLESRLDSMESMFREFINKFPMEPARPPVNTSGEPMQDAAAGSNDGLPLDEGLVQLPEDNDFNAVEETRDFGTPALSLDSEQRVTHADNFGELGLDDSGELRYIGLGSMTSIIDACEGLRRHIYSGLEKKGYLPRESFLSSPKSTYDVVASNDYSHRRDSILRLLPSAQVIDFLIDTYERDLYAMFPIRKGSEVRSAFRDLQNFDEPDVGSAAILFALLAVALPLARHSRRNELERLFGRQDFSTAESQYYDIAKRLIDTPLAESRRSTKRNWKIVTALGLLSMYLGEIGSQADAWIAVGRAVRMGQDLGFHVSPFQV